MDVNCFSVDHCPADKSTAGHWSSFLSSEDRYRSMQSDEPKLITVSTPNCRVACITKARRIFCDHVQHRLNVSWRTGDDAQDFTRHGLLLQGLAKS